jgi:hypothetical protein
LEKIIEWTIKKHQRYKYPIQEITIISKGVTAAIQRSYKKSYIPACSVEEQLKTIIHGKQKTQSRISKKAKYKGIFFKIQYATKKHGNPLRSDVFSIKKNENQIYYVCSDIYEYLTDPLEPLNDELIKNYPNNIQCSSNVGFDDYMGGIKLDTCVIIVLDPEIELSPGQFEKLIYYQFLYPKIIIICPEMDLYLSLKFTKIILLDKSKYQVIDFVFQNWENDQTSQEFIQNHFPVSMQKELKCWVHY